MLWHSPWSNHADVRFFSFRVPNLSVVFLQEKKYHCLQDSGKQKSEEKMKKGKIESFTVFGHSSHRTHINFLKNSALGKYSTSTQHIAVQYFLFIQIGKYPTSNLNLLNLKYVDKAAAELWVEVQIEQMSFVLLLLQNLTKVVTMSKIRCFICVFPFTTFIYSHHKVKTNLGEDVSGCALLFALLLCGLCLLSCFL